MVAKLVSLGSFYSKHILGEGVESTPYMHVLRVSSTHGLG